MERQWTAQGGRPEEVLVDFWDGSPGLYWEEVSFVLFSLHMLLAHPSLHCCRSPASSTASSLPFDYLHANVTKSLPRLPLPSLATMQMQLLIAMLVLRYDMELRNEVLESVEGFMHKPVAVWVRLRRRMTTGKK